MAKKKKTNDDSEFLSGRELAEHNKKLSSIGCSCSRCVEQDTCDDHRRYLGNLERVHCVLHLAPGI